MKDYEQLATKIMMNALEGVKAQIRKAYDKGYKDGKADTPFTDTEEAENKAYNRGLADMLEVFKCMRMMTADELEEIFGLRFVGDVLVNLSPSKIISKYHVFKAQIDDWRDIPSEEMTLEQARRAVKELRAEVVGKILTEEQSNDE